MTSLWILSSVIGAYFISKYLKSEFNLNQDSDTRHTTLAAYSNSIDHEKLFNQGVLDLELQNYGRAFSALDKYITHYPKDNGLAYLFRGQAWSSMLAIRLNDGEQLTYADGRQSIQDYSLAMKFAPQIKKEAHYQRGLVYGMINNYEDAMEDFLMADNLGHPEAKEKINHINFMKLII